MGKLRFINERAVLVDEHVPRLFQNPLSVAPPPDEEPDRTTVGQMKRQRMGEGAPLHADHVGTLIASAPRREDDDTNRADVNVSEHANSWQTQETRARRTR
jgi:hypothetical protein